MSTEAGEILGISQRLPYGERSAKHLLFHTFRTIVLCKLQDWNVAAQTLGGAGMGGGYGVGGGGGGGGSERAGRGEVIYTLDGQSSVGGQERTQHLAHVDLAPLNLSHRGGNLMVSTIILLVFIVMFI